MDKHSYSTFEVKTWDEKTYAEMGGKTKLTRATVTKTFKGDIVGEGTIEYLMAYSADGTASFVGMERITGRIGNRSGSFVLQHSGTDDGSSTQSDWFVVEGAGTGELASLRGHGGGTISRNQPDYAMSLDYDFG